MDRNVFLTLTVRNVPIVALRKESVDRNHVVLVVSSGCWLSLSARRAWIEIPFRSFVQFRKHVALRKESVDRNINKSIVKCTG